MLDLLLTSQFAETCPDAEHVSHFTAAQGLGTHYEFQVTKGWLTPSSRHPDQGVTALKRIFHHVVSNPICDVFHCCPECGDGKVQYASGWRDGHHVAIASSKVRWRAKERDGQCCSWQTATFTCQQCGVVRCFRVWRQGCLQVHHPRTRRRRSCPASVLGLWKRPPGLRKALLRRPKNGQEMQQLLVRKQFEGTINQLPVADIWLMHIYRRRRAYLEDALGQFCFGVSSGCGVPLAHLVLQYYSVTVPLPGDVQLDVVVSGFDVPFNAARSLEFDGDIRPHGMRCGRIS